MAHKFLVHAKEDHVGVAVEDIRAGEAVEGVFLDDESIVTVKAIQDIPLEHKIALTSLAEGAKVGRWKARFTRIDAKTENTASGTMS